MSQNATVTIAVIGAGEMGRQHALILNGRADATVVAVVDPMPAAEAFAAELGAMWLPSIDALEALVAAGELKLDGVVVTLPNSLHEAASVWALKRGIGVFCEKPMAHDLGAAWRILTAAGEGRAELMFGYHLPFHPEVARAIAAAREHVGMVLHARVTAVRGDGVPDREAFKNRSRTGGGPLVDLAGHPLSVMFEAIGLLDINWISGNVYPLHPAGSNAVEDWASATVMLAARDWANSTGVRVELETSWKAHLPAGSPAEYWGVELRGTEGSVRLELPFNAAGKPAYPHELGTFVGMLREGGLDRSRVMVAMRIQEIIAGAYKSAEADGHPVAVTGKDLHWI